MDQRKLTKSEWQTFFDNCSKAIKSEMEDVEIEVAGLDIGNQIAEEWTLLEGISFDPNDNKLFVHTKPLDHAIANPQDIFVTSHGDSIVSIAVKDDEGRIQTLNFKNSLGGEAGAKIA